MAQRAPKAPPTLAAQPPAAFQHAPYVEQSCGVCHGSERPSAKDVTQETPDLCYKCHEAFTKTFVHSPVSVGECLICHDPHQSAYPFFLRQNIPDLCFLCHTRMQSIITKAQNVKHPPATDNCVACHNPHGSDINNKFFQKEMQALCTDCHQAQKVPMETHIATVTHKHKPAVEGVKCANCHDPHASSFAFHLRAEPMDVCLSCHNMEVRAYDGEILTNMEALLKANPDHHGPIRDKNCSGCHNPHGSNYFRILIETYPKAFYTESFSLENFNLCFSCHESSLLRDRETTTLTNFRNGKRNLHFLHVHRAEKGRTCRACHETHASTHPKHIREAVPFGKARWPLRLKYRVEYADTTTGRPCDQPGATCVPTGGSCVGCHARQYYNYRVQSQPGK